MGSGQGVAGYGRAEMSTKITIETEYRKVTVETMETDAPIGEMLELFKSAMMAVGFSYLQDVDIVVAKGGGE